MHVVFSGGGGAGGGASGGSVSVACTCTSVACAARVTKSSNAADHGGIGTLRLRKGAVVTSYHRQACQVALTLNRRGMVRANPGPAAAVEAPFTRQVPAQLFLTPYPLHHRTARQTSLPRYPSRPVEANSVDWTPEEGAPERQRGRREKFAN